jgi:putative PIN family toxin of toxin-antitoxin system
MDMLIEEATVVVSPEMITELRRIVHAKFPAFLEDLQRLEQLLKRDGVQVTLGSIHVSASRDPDDNKVIETALAGACSHIISGDKDLLDLKQYEHIQIVTPAEFLDITEED